MMPMVLVVDDDMRLRDLLGKFLSDYSYRVQTAANAAQARAQLASQHFDMIILDIMMPKESGLELLASLRSAQSSYKQIPVILLTAQDMNLKNRNILVSLFLIARTSLSLRAPPPKSFKFNI